MGIMDEIKARAEANKRAAEAEEANDTASDETQEPTAQVEDLDKPRDL